MLDQAHIQKAQGQERKQQYKYNDLILPLNNDQSEPYSCYR